MKGILLSLAWFLIATSDNSCKVCSPDKYEFNISAETTAWLPDSILTPAITFISDYGDIITFEREPILHREHQWSYGVVCEDFYKKETIYYERIAHPYSSGDSMSLLMSTNIEPTTCGWGNVKEVKLLENVWVMIDKRKPYFDTLSAGIQKKRIDIGSLSIHTKLINTSADEKICNKMFAKMNDSIDLHGNYFYDIYTDDRPGHENAEFPFAEIFFRKGKGIIGFRDENGTEWLRVN